ncbi:hypothetical protein KHP62_16770 [Rhodobacteraceae bacterium NNCM2]|nr:hypothetical protein [Coraliihabitans acroporae]
MRLIGHRVFKDDEPIRPFQTDGTLRLDGVELDIRCDSAGMVSVYHAPFFQLRSKRLAHIPKSLRAALHFLSEKIEGLSVVMLDVKSTKAADALGRYLTGVTLPFELVFNCWHGDDVAALRRHLPRAEIFYCLAPIFARRIPKGRFSDLYVCNSFPFLSSTSRFKPKHAKTNRHNLNVQLISSREFEAHLPRGIDGVCVHRMFCKPELIELAGRRDLGIAVYGISASKAKRLQRVSAFADYAIVSDRKQPRPETTTSNLDRAV